MSVIKIDREHLGQWRFLDTYIKERDEKVECHAIVEDGAVRAIMLSEPGRIHHIYVPEDCRRGGYATELVKLAINNLYLGQPVSVCIERDQLGIVILFLKLGFQPQGFNVTWGDNRYLLTYGKDIEPSNFDPLKDVKADLDDVVKKMYVSECLPFKV